MAPKNVASLLIFIDYILDDYLSDIAITAPNKDELFSAFLTGVRKKRIRNELFVKNIIPRYSVVVKSSPPSIGFMLQNDG